MGRGWESRGGVAEGRGRVKTERFRGSADHGAKGRTRVERFGGGGVGVEAKMRGGRREKGFAHHQFLADVICGSSLACRKQTVW